MPRLAGVAISVLVLIPGLFLPILTIQGSLNPKSVADLSHRLLEQGISDSAVDSIRSMINPNILPLLEASQGADPPFQSASVSRGNTQRSATIASLDVRYTGDRWQRALIEADKIRRQVLEQGVTQQEVDRVVTNALAGAQAGVAAGQEAHQGQLRGYRRRRQAQVDRLYGVCEDSLSAGKNACSLGW
jgi:hypothetical protein